MQIITKSTAQAHGLARYYEGVPCAKGHDSGRYTKSDVCVGCATGRSLRYATRKKMEKLWVEVGVPADMPPEMKDALVIWLRFQATIPFIKQAIWGTDPMLTMSMGPPVPEPAFDNQVKSTP
jgi:hypothetical protein